MRDPLFTRNWDANTDECRDATLKQFLHIAKGLNLANAEDVANPNRTISACIAVAGYDTGLFFRFLVPYILYMESLKACGTEKHAHLIEKAYRLEDVACFGMTELG
jgi:hypothetical protein